MIFKEFRGKQTVAYGCIVTNKKMLPEETLLYSELENLFHADKTVVEIAMVNVQKRPVLNELIDSLEEHDRIYIEDIADLFGKTNKAKIYYKKAIEKGIELFIADLNHTLFHIHPLSFTPQNSIHENEAEINGLLSVFDYFEKQYFKKETNRRKRHIYDFSEKWKRMYFDYESYQIDHFELLERAKELGISNYPTLMNRIAEYEKSIEYQDDLLEYTRMDPDFLKTPKRIISRSKDGYLLPEEYWRIKEKMYEECVTVNVTYENFDKTSYITNTGEVLNFLINNVIFERYRLLETMKVPRKLRTGIDIHF